METYSSGKHHLNLSLCASCSIHFISPLYPIPQVSLSVDLFGGANTEQQHRLMCSGNNQFFYLLKSILIASSDYGINRVIANCVINGYSYILGSNDQITDIFQKVIKHSLLPPGGTLFTKNASRIRNAELIFARFACPKLAISSASRLMLLTELFVFI